MKTGPKYSHYPRYENLYGSSHGVIRIRDEMNEVGAEQSTRASEIMYGIIRNIFHSSAIIGKGPLRATIESSDSLLM